jgi:hypothetical protein
MIERGTGLLGIVNAAGARQGEDMEDNNEPVRRVTVLKASRRERLGSNSATTTFCIQFPGAL